jgi:NADH-quinone oxidoreductase subunit E
VATFYTLFHLEPVGKHRFYVCTNLSCTLRGAEEIVAHLRTAIGVKEAGEVSKDGLFSYEEVECLGACEYAPMCRLDHRYQVDLTVEKMDALIAERRDATASASAGPPVNAPARRSGGKDGPNRSLPNPLPARGARADSSDATSKAVKAPRKRATKKDG